MSNNLWPDYIDFSQKLTKVKSQDDITIPGVTVYNLKYHVDGRGKLIELFSRPWGQELTCPSHVYSSFTDQGVIKAWHMHNVHTDQLCCFAGKIQVCCLYKDQINSIISGRDNPMLITIKPGIIHGWKALTDGVFVVNLASHVYDPQDEIRFAWDDMPALIHVWEPRNG